MNNKFLQFFFGLLFTSFMCVAQIEVPNKALKYEFRAAWIATVDNIDWPKRGQYNSELQKQDFVRILNEHQKTNLNAVFVQVRDACDAYYAKGIEPWSEFLTGQQGKFPTPFYDPLSFMIDEAHNRNLEFHAWLNLNRATFKKTKTLSPDHISKTKPEWMLTYDGQQFLNFGIPAVRQYITEVVIQIVKNYDIDGIHFDDYFYPYEVAGEVLRDEQTFKKYSGGNKSIEEWRRSNTDSLIFQISQAINKEKPTIKFGISPFGVWRNHSPKSPGGSNTQAGQTSYDNLFADTRKWLQKGWIDYIAPQIYFEQNHPKIPYAELSRWWRENTFGKHLYIGQGIYKIRTGWSLTEVPKQIQLNRKHILSHGSIFFSSKSLTENYGGFQDTLRKNYYRMPAIIPSMPWKDSIPPLSPQKLLIIKNEKGLTKLTWQPGERAADNDENHYFAVYRFEKGEKPNLSKADKIVYIGKKNTFEDANAEKFRGYIYCVTSFDRLHNESEDYAIFSTEYGYESSK